MTQTEQCRLRTRARTHTHLKGGEWWCKEISQRFKMFCFSSSGVHPVNRINEQEVLVCWLLLPIFKWDSATKQTRTWVTSVKRSGTTKLSVQSGMEESFLFHEPLCNISPILTRVSFCIRVGLAREVARLKSGAIASNNRHSSLGLLHLVRRSSQSRACYSQMILRFFPLWAASVRNRLLSQLPGSAPGLPAVLGLVATCLVLPTWADLASSTTSQAPERRNFWLFA